MGVKPYVTLVTSFDMPIKIQIDQPINETYDVSITHNGNPVKNITGVKGGAIIDVGTPQDIGLSPGTVDKIDVVLTKGGNVIDAKSLPVLYIDGTQATLWLKDENGNELIGDVVIGDLKNQTILSYHGSVISIPKNVSPIDYSQLYVEFGATTPDGKKYYYLSRIDRLNLQSGTYVITLKPVDKIPVGIQVTIDTSNAGVLSGLFDWLVDAGGWLASIWGKLNITYPGYLVANVVKLFGINLPILDFSYDSNTNTLRIWFENDVHPILIIALVLAGLVVAGITVVRVTDVLMEQQKTAQIQALSQIQQHILQIQEQAINACREQYANDVDSYIKCVQGVSGITNSLATPLNAGFSTVTQQNDQLSRTIQMLQTILIIAIAGMLIINIVRR